MLALGPSPAFGQAREHADRSQFKRIAELIRIIETARDAGLSEEEIRGLTIQDGSKSVNLLDYIEAIREEERMRIRRMEEFKKKQFLTEKDLFKELLNKEREELSQLREKLTGD